jgi:hypothetical protein
MNLSLSNASVDQAGPAESVLEVTLSSSGVVHAYVDQKVMH